MGFNCLPPSSNLPSCPPVKPRDLGPETAACMSVVCDRVRREVSDPAGIPAGVQVLAGANREAVAVARAAGMRFVRAEGFVFSHVADEGFTDACAGALLRYRRAVGADGDVAVFCDVKKKHCSHAVTADLSAAETARAAAFFAADGVVLTGAATGEEADADEVREVSLAVPDTPVLVGSGVTAGNVGRFARVAHGMIVGSFFKRGGDWRNELDERRMEAMAEALQRIER